jgi:four helix bundle protein
MEIFEISKRFPKEEKYSLTDQIRRSSRSVCSNLPESYRKRRYPAHFLSKLTDSDMENSETDVWLEFSRACNYITEEESIILQTKNTEVGKMIGYMIQNPQKYCLRA